MKGEELKEKIRLSGRRFNEVADAMGITPQALQKIFGSDDVKTSAIALALGHSSAHTTTAIYIQRDLRKVDAANRKVIDFVLNKKPDAQ